MNPVLPDEAVELGAAAAKAFGALGGVDAARRAESDPGVRAAEVADVLHALGLPDLDPRDDAVSLAASAALCEAAGGVALPYPVASALVRDPDGRPSAVVPDGIARVDHGDLLGEWRLHRLDGTTVTAAAATTRLATRLGPFVADLPVTSGSQSERKAQRLGPRTDDAADRSTSGSQSERNPLRSGPRTGSALQRDALLVLALGAWTLLGTADRAAQLATDHVNGRVQFGKPLAAFQAVQFQLADVAVAVAGLRELARFTLWRLGADDAAADVLALRVHALDVTRAVLRTAQQLHGAAGVCDEYDVSVLTRMAQPGLRLPWSAERTAAALAATIDRQGFAGLFPHGRFPA